MLGYDVSKDQERPAGLRLVEWLRGYAFLRCLAQERFDIRPDGIILLDEDELRSGLKRVGIEAGAAATFIRQVSLGRSSRDLEAARRAATSNHHRRPAR